MLTHETKKIAHTTDVARYQLGTIACKFYLKPSFKPSSSAVSHLGADCVLLHAKGALRRRRTSISASGAMMATKIKAAPEIATGVVG
jgi:hypothetical protein